MKTQGISSTPKATYTDYTYINALHAGPWISRSTSLKARASAYEVYQAKPKQLPA